MPPESTAIVDAAMFTPLTTAITDNLLVLIPVGLAVLAIMLGVALIPRVIRKFF